MSAADAGASGASFSGPQSLALVSGIFPSLSDEIGALPEFVEGVEPGYRCCRCGEVLRQPKQTPCGHRLCTPCVDQLSQQHQTAAFHCPANEDECEDMIIEQVCQKMLSTSRHVFEALKFRFLHGVGIVC